MDLLVAGRWVAVVVLGALAVALAAINAWVVARGGFTRRWIGRSVAPVLGGLSGALALVLAPVGDLDERAGVVWLPLVADLGCAAFLVRSALGALWRGGGGSGGGRAASPPRGRP